MRATATASAPPLTRNDCEVTDDGKVYWRKLRPRQKPQWGSDGNPSTIALLLDFFKSDRRLWGQFRNGDDLVTPEQVAAKAERYLKANYGPVRHTALEIKNHLNTQVIKKYMKALKLDLYTTGWGEGFPLVVGKNEDGSNKVVVIEDTEGR